MPNNNAIDETKHVLFLCVANSARSQMAEGIARHLFPKNVQVSSAGSHPGIVNPLAVKVLEEKNIDISSHYSKGVKDIEQDSVDVVVTLCAEEVCPIFPRQVTKLHWSLPDPANINDAEIIQLENFRKIRDELFDRLKEYTNTNFE